MSVIVRKFSRHEYTLMVQEHAKRASWFNVFLSFVQEVAADVAQKVEASEAFNIFTEVIRFGICRVFFEVIND